MISDASYLMFDFFILFHMIDKTAACSYFTPKSKDKNRKLYLRKDDKARFSEH